MRNIEAFVTGAGGRGTATRWQAIVADPTSSHGLTLSNAVRGLAP